MKNNQFNINRCWQLLRQHLINGRLDLLLVALLTFFGALAAYAFGIFSGVSTMGRANLPFDQSLLPSFSAISNAGLVLLLIEIVALSSVFANMSKRSGEIQYLLLPATNGEKWFSRIAYALILGFVVPTLFYYLALLFASGIGYLFDIQSLSVLFKLNFDNSYVASVLPGEFTMHWWYTPVNWCMSIFFVAAFLLGGTIWRHQPWLYTSLSVLAFLFVMVFTSGFGIGYYFFKNGAFNKADLQENPFLIIEDMQPFIIGSAIVALLLSALMIWLSYRLFCRRQMETQKIRILA
ncbi:MAG: hypothetical protein K6C10_00345 [Prevotella sp.]|nr:hypothetical protein [Prevotella sp.]